MKYHKTSNQGNRSRTASGKRWHRVIGWSSSMRLAFGTPALALSVGLAGGLLAPQVMGATWDVTPGAVGTGDGVTTDGSGTWNTTNGMWTADNGANNIAWTNGSDAVFTGTTGGTISLSADITANTVTINGTKDYTIGTGSTPRRIFTTNGLTVDTTGIITFNSAVSGPGGITKKGTGTLILSNTNSNFNTFGNLNIEEGVVRSTVAGAMGPSNQVRTTTVAQGAALELASTGTASNNKLILNGDGINHTGALRFLSGGISLNGPIVLGSDAKIVTVAGSMANSPKLTGPGMDLGSHTLTWGGDSQLSIVGDINLTIKGAGGIILDLDNSSKLLSFSQINDHNTYTGQTWVKNGILRFSSFSGARAITGDGIAATPNGDLWIGGGGSSTSATVLYTSNNAVADNAEVFMDVTGTPTLNLNSRSDVIGSLASANAGASVLLGNTGTLTVSNGIAGTGDTTFAGAITGGGSLVKQGSGVFTLTGTSSVGTLSNQAGTLALGSTGSITTGAFTQLAAATLSLDATSPGAPLKVTGDAALAGNIKLANTNALSGPVNKVLVDVAGTTNGTFNQREGAVLASKGDFRYLVSYLLGDGNDVGITSTFDPSLSLIPAVQDLMRISQNSALGVMDDMEDRTMLHRRIGFFEDRMSGGGSVAATLERSAGLPDGVSPGQFDFTAGGEKHGTAYATGSYGQFDYDGGLSGNSQRYMVGYDAVLRSDAWIGADFSYSRTDWEHVLTTGDLDAYRISLYGTWKLQPDWFLDAGVGGGLLQLSTERSGGQKGDIDGWDSFAFTRLAWRAIDQQSNGVISRLEPFVGLRVVHTDLDGYSEEGSSSLGIGSQASNLGQVFAGVNWSQWFDLPGHRDSALGYHVRLQGFLGDADQTKSSKVMVLGSAASPVSITDGEADRWGGRLTIGADYRIGDWTISADASASEGDRSDSWQSKLNVSWWW